MTTKALITGGAGFIGSHLCERLLKAGQEVFVLDDLSTGSIDNIRHLKANPRFHYEIDSVMHEPLLAELVDSSDVIYHLAATVGVQLVVHSPVSTIENTFKGTELVLKWANKKKKKVLITSTSEVYGKSIKIPFTEEDDLLIGPSYIGRWSYACSKALDEFLGLAYYREQRLPVVITRLFNTVGPRQTGRYGMVIPRFVRQALGGKDLTVYGDGAQTRCFAYVGDVVDALYRLMEDERTAGQIFNVGNPQEVSINELAARIIQLTESSSKVEHIPYDVAYDEGFEDMRRRVPSIEKIRRVIGFEPTARLDDIIRFVVEFQSQLDQQTL